jgi:hypothetical protein
VLKTVLLGVRENVWSKKYIIFLRNVVKYDYRLSKILKYRYSKKLLKYFTPLVFVTHQKLGAAILQMNQ